MANDWNADVFISIHNNALYKAMHGTMTSSTLEVIQARSMQQLSIMIYLKTLEPMILTV